MQSCSSTHCTSTNPFTPKPAHLSLPRMLLHASLAAVPLPWHRSSSRAQVAGGTPGAGVQFPLQEDTPLLQPSAPASFVPCVPPRGITGIVTADSSVCCGASREIAPVFLGYQLDTGLKMEDKEFTVKKKNQWQPCCI